MSSTMQMNPYQGASHGSGGIVPGKRQHKKPAKSNRERKW